MASGERQVRGGVWLVGRREVAAYREVAAADVGTTMQLPRM